MLNPKLLKLSTRPCSSCPSRTQIAKTMTMTIIAVVVTMAVDATTTMTTTMTTIL
jgi:hypothetical protein